MIVYNKGLQKGGTNGQVVKKNTICPSSELEFSSDTEEGASAVMIKYSACYHRRTKSLIAPRQTGRSPE